MTPISNLLNSPQQFPIATLEGTVVHVFATNPITAIAIAILIFVGIYLCTRLYDYFTPTEMPQRPSITPGRLSTIEEEVSPTIAMQKDNKPYLIVSILQQESCQYPCSSGNNTGSTNLTDADLKAILEECPSITPSTFKNLWTMIPDVPVAKYDKTKYSLVEHQALVTQQKTSFRKIYRIQSFYSLIQKDYPDLAKQIRVEAENSVVGITFPEEPTPATKIFFFLQHLPEIFYRR